MKVCSKCGRAKPLSDFYALKAAKDGRHSQCKSCFKEGAATYRQANSEKRKRAAREYYLLNRAGCIAKSTLWKLNNPEKAREQQKIFKQRNPQKIRAYKRRYKNRKYATDLAFRLECCFRSRVLETFKSQRARKIEKSKSWLGCSSTQFKEYIRAQFRSGMTEENHGKVWELDHVAPVSAFDLSDPAQVRCCFHHTNFQPLFKEENHKKGVLLM